MPADTKGRPKGDHLKRVGILFAGGPAPAANAVISSAAVSFLDTDRTVFGFLRGYEYLQQYDPEEHPLDLDTHYRELRPRDVAGQRNVQGVMIGTSRANPGKYVRGPADLDDSQRTERLRRVCRALTDLDIDALISIGGDDTLKTANLLFEFQKHLPEGAPRFHVVHLPKTIDNDYKGIDFTFGYFTAVDWLAREVKNLRADAAASNSYYIIESMGRKAGWLSYGTGIAGEANMIFSVEDVTEDMTIEEEVVDPSNGEKRTERRLKAESLIDKIVDVIVSREKKEAKYYGTIVLAEGLVEMFPDSYLKNLGRDEHGHLTLGNIHLARIVAEGVTKEYEKRTGRRKKIRGLQLGYESRCAPAHAFDIILGSQLGIGAYRALVEENLDGHMVSVTGQLDLRYVPFSSLINPETLQTEIQYIKRGSDFHRLARFLESRTEVPEE
jgi:6-phosphofructokinase